MRKIPRVLGVLAVMSLAAGLFVLMTSAAAASTQLHAQTSPSASASPSPSSSGSGGVLPGGSPSASPSTSVSASPTETGSAAPAPTGSSSVLGTTIPKTGAGMALPLIVGGAILATASIFMRRALTHRA